MMEDDQAWERTDEIGRYAVSGGRPCRSSAKGVAMNVGRGSDSEPQWVKLSSDHYINIGLVGEVIEVEAADPSDKALEVRWASGNDPLVLVGDERAALLAHLGLRDG